MYGGRAIDSFDRRILTVYMDEYFGDFLFYTFQRFHFFSNKDVAYKVPPNGPKTAYVGQWLLSHFHNLQIIFSYYSQIFPVTSYR